MTPDPYRLLLHRPLHTIGDRNQQAAALHDIAQTAAQRLAAGHTPETVRRHVIARLNRMQLQQLALLLIGAAGDWLLVEPETDHINCDNDPCPDCLAGVGRRPRDHIQVPELVTPVDEVLLTRATRGQPLPLNVEDRRAAVTYLTNAGAAIPAIATALQVAAQTVRRDLEHGAEQQGAAA
jgi:hypothetical protein